MSTRYFAGVLCALTALYYGCRHATVSAKQARKWEAGRLKLISRDLLAEGALS